MLTIQNIDKISGMTFPNGWNVNGIEANSDMYKIHLIKGITIYDPATFQPLQRTHEKIITLQRFRYADTYALSDGTYFNQLTLNDVKDWDVFIYKMNDLLNRWKN